MGYAFSGDNAKHHQSLSDIEVNNWKEMLRNSKNSPHVEAQAYEAQLNENVSVFSSYHFVFCLIYSHILVILLTISSFSYC